MRPRGKFLVDAMARCAGILIIAVTATTMGHAVQIPAWLDDGIAQWNKENPENPIRFVDVRDSYVWYTMAATSQLSAKEIRGKVYGIAYKNKYANTQDEEIVTTARPPVKDGVSTSKKCWSRSFIRDVDTNSPTTSQRMLTTMVCEDPPNWSLGFRTLQ